MKHKPYDVAIIGGGLAGMTLAALCGAGGLSVLCVDQVDPAVQMKRDERTMAVSYGSHLILKKAGLWDSCAPEACPIKDIRILDGRDSPLFLNFLSDEIEGRNFGWIIDTATLRKACLEKLAELPSVTLRAPARASDFSLGEKRASFTLDSGETITASLLIGADGRGSPLRAALDIPTRHRDYGQRALVCIVSHENPHYNVAVEHFWPEGPFAVLPASDGLDGTHRSSVVFTEHGLESRSMMHFSREAFLTALRLKMPESYGHVEILKGPQAYPLTLVHAARYTGPRAALIGDAAHGIHPIAGQGLNLGYRDVKVLADLLIEAKAAGADLGAPELLESYERARRADVLGMIAFTDAMVRLFSNDILPVRLLRKAGLRAVARFPLAKRFFMKRAMGE